MVSVSVNVFNECVSISVVHVDASNGGTGNEILYNNFATRGKNTTIVAKQFSNP